MTEYNNQQQHLQNDEYENGSGLTLHDLLQMVLANWYWFALSVLICLGVAYYYLASTPKIYSRTATILVKDSRKGGDMELGVFSDLVGFQNRRNVDNEVTVIMIGDGVNDSPALSEADAGVAISTGAAIAREIADITIASEDLFELVTLRKISEALMGRIHRNYRFIVGFNLGLIVFGVAGLLPPTTSALLHNASTLAISLKSMTNLLPDKKKI